MASSVRERQAEPPCRSRGVLCSTHVITVGAVSRQGYCAVQTTNATAKHVTATAYTGCQAGVSTWWSVVCRVPRANPE